MCLCVFMHVCMHASMCSHAYVFTVCILSYNVKLTCINNAQCSRVILFSSLIICDYLIERNTVGAYCYQIKYGLF